MKKSKVLLVYIFIVFIFIQCSDFLNIVPDNIPTIEYSFNNREEAEKFLYGCFSFLPSHADINANPALVGGDEVWLIDPIYTFGSPNLWYIARGDQGTETPLANYWSSKTSDSAKGGKRLFTGLSDCNIFLENIDKPFDLQEYEKRQWIAEIKFLKAYFHFWLFRMYGPIPLIKENLSISASPNEVKLYREPIDEVIEYIVELLDESLNDLPTEVISTNLGRPSKAAALSLKAIVLTYAASPLYNGNTDYADMIDNRGIQLFPQKYKTEKWERAAEALKIAIHACLESGHQLYDFHTSSFSSNLKEETILAQQVRTAVTERWNPEIIWGDSNSSTTDLQRLCQPGFFPAHGVGGDIFASYAPPLNIIEQFYTNHGVPIEEDKDWNNVDFFELKKGDADHKYYIKEDYTTISLHFKREPRFYGSISFDGGIFYGNGRLFNEKDLLHTELIWGGAGMSNIARYSSTGYLVKKLINIQTLVEDNSGSLTRFKYAFPIIRLADLYLMYSEALNEIKSSPDTDVYEYINYIRERSGLEGVMESWQKYSSDPNKPTTKEGMREIIQRERLIELAFEGSRFWDLRRWKLAEKYMNQPIIGLNSFGEIPSEFYKTRTIYELSFKKKDYLWPIKQSELVRNHNLLQNPGW